MCRNRHYNHIHYDNISYVYYTDVPQGLTVAPAVRPIFDFQLLTSPFFNDKLNPIFELDGYKR